MSKWRLQHVAAILCMVVALCSRDVENIVQWMVFGFIWFNLGELALRNESKETK